MSGDQPAPDQPRTRPHRPRARSDPVRGSGRRLGQDDGARRPGDGPRHHGHGRAPDRRRHHVHRESRVPSYGTAFASSWRRRRKPTTTPRWWRGAAPRSISSTARQSGPSTRSPSGSSRRTRSRPGFHREWRCSTRSAQVPSSSGAGPASVTSCWLIRSLERTLLLFFASGVQPDALRVLGLGIRPELGPRRGTGAEECVAEPRRMGELLEAALEPIDVVCGLRAHCTDHGDKLCTRLDEIAEYADETPLDRRRVRAARCDLGRRQAQARRASTSTTEASRANGRSTSVMCRLGSAWRTSA